MMRCARVARAMSLRFLRRWPLVVSCALAAAPLPAAAEPEELLQKVVIVSRHGVRTPTVPPSELSLWAAQPWPEWNQPLGSLTPRGAQLATLMGRYYREYVGSQGLMPAAGCPDRRAVYVYADVAERTRATARALIDGFAANCGIDYRTSGDVEVDPLFHPLEAGVCRLDPMLAQTSVLERAGGDLNRATRDLKGPFDTLQSVLQCCKPVLCTAFGRGEQCRLSDLPTALSLLPDGSGMSLIGALAIASTASEVLLLEFANGMPPTVVGWGRMSSAQMRDVMRLHTEQYNLMQRTPYLARRKGSALLSKVAGAVTSARLLGFGTPDPAVRDAKFVAFVGHDTNIWNLAAIMDVSWLQPGYQRNQTPPAGALMFEVRETADKKLRVYTSYLAQSPEQMNAATVLNADAPPARTPLRLPGCSSSAPGFPCTIEEFGVAMRNSLERDCVE